MASTFTTARNLEKPGSGDFVGTWDAPVNANYDVVDAGMGQTATISGAAGSVVLSAAQFRSAQITFNSTLLASITVTFPTSFTGPYVAYNACTGSSAFTITLATTAVGGQAIAVKPGEPCDVWNDGTNLRYRNLGHIGSYWDYAGSSVPNWVSGCTIPPYVACDGTAISSVTHPLLYNIVGATTPDLRGRSRAYLNQGTGRLTSSQGGVDGNTNFASGGAQVTTLSSQHIPPVPVTVNETAHGHPVRTDISGSDNTNTFGGFALESANTTTFGAYTGAPSNTAGEQIGGNTTGITVTAGSTSPTAFSLLPPIAVGGITMIRAA